MKNWKLKTFMAVIAFLSIIVGFTGCDDSIGEPTYTVWTDTISYSEFNNLIGELEDGYYFTVEFTNSQFSEFLSTLGNEGKHQWTEDQINTWFIGRGFGDKEARRETAWLMTVDHGLIATRTGPIVYALIK